MKQDMIILPDRQTTLAEPAMAERLARVEFDRQIATARQFPRSIEKAVAAITTFATLDPETAQDCMYVLPRDGKSISGPSARLAEIIASQWGNNRAAARVVIVDRDEGYIEAEGFFHDLETNSATTSRVRRNIKGKSGRLFSDDMIIVTGNAACSIAKRNATLGGVPKPVWRQAYERAQAVIKGTVKTLGPMREQTIAAFKEIGVSAPQVLKALGVAAVGDIKLDDIVTLRGMFATLKNGEATIEEMFGGEPTKAERAEAAKASSPDIPDGQEEEKVEPEKAPAEGATAFASSAAPTQQSALLPKIETKPGLEAEGDMFPGDIPSKSGGVDADEFLASLATELRNADDMDELDKLKRTHESTIKRLPNNYAAKATKLFDDAYFAAS